MLFSIHKRVVRALKESEEKYRLLVNNANEAIFIIRDRFIAFANPNTLALLGYSQQEILSTPFENLIHYDDKVEVIESLDKDVIENKGSCHYSCRMLNKEGDEVLIRSNAVVINWEGKPAVLNFARDLTRQRVLEDQLLQAHKMEAIHTLIGGISNDLNNLLMGIQGNTSLMLIDVCHDSPHYNRLKEIERLINNGAAISEKLFGFTQRGNYLVRPNKINQIISSTLEQFRSEKENIAIHENYSQDDITVDVDKRQIEQALLNVCVNAWQAMPKGGDLYASTDIVKFNEDYAKPFGLVCGYYVRISITDTGIGMDKQTQIRIFDPFFTTKKWDKEWA
ncbi:MAG: PAS domain S-box protein [Deltaproteobacteria bacterium]|nr:PAS domain S-box protein [Deltaproteobacteria bacterium]